MNRTVRLLRGLIVAAMALPAFLQAREAAPAAADIAYVAGSTDEGHRLDVYRGPAGGSESAGQPVLMYVHGGGWGRGDKRMARSLASLYEDNSVVFVSVNYRLAPRNRYPLFMHDLAAATRWVKDNIARYGGDPNRIVLTGHSAGAHLVALLGTDPQFLHGQGLALNTFKAVVPVDTASFDFTVDPYGWFADRQKKIRAEAFGSDRAVLEAASPALIARQARAASLAPMRIFVSGKRPDAMAQSEAFAKAVRATGNEATVTVIPDLGHARMNQALGDEKSPLSRTVLELLARR